MGTLYLVATPIGNLEDLSPRAVRILRSVSVIAAEDTRHTGRLMKHFEIDTPLATYHDHNKEKALAPLLARLAEGDVALVSDAGTPGLNDPGFALVRAAIAAGHTVSPVPGPSAPVAALVASGLPCDTFLYLGYLPRKGGERRNLLKNIADQTHTLLFLETPHRLLDALEDMETILGDRQIVVAREMTKMHEQFVRGRVSEVRGHFEEQAPRGEITLVVAGADASAERWSEKAMTEAIRAGLQAGEGAAGLAKRLAGESGWTRRGVYARIQEIQEQGDA